jgi:hypothetical protein
MNNHIKSLFALGAGLALFAGCEKKEATPPTQEPPKAAASQPADTNAVTNLQQEADKAAAKVQEQATQAVDTLKKETNSALNSLTDKTNASLSMADSATKVIEAAKKLTDENKYDEALKMLGTLTSNKLTPDQQKMVDSLKEQIQKAMAAKATDSATKAVGDLLKK